MMEKRWMWYETLFLGTKEKLCDYMRRHGIRFECSGMNPGYHLEIFCDDYEAEDLDHILMEDAIVEVTA